MSKAPSRSRCPECKKLSERHWGDVPLVFNGAGYYTNKRKQHKLVYEDKAKGKEVMENILDASKRMAESKKTPYASYMLNEKGMKEFGARRKTDAEIKGSRETAGEIQKSVYNNSEAYRKLKRNN